MAEGNGFTNKEMLVRLEQKVDDGFREIKEEIKALKQHRYIPWPSTATSLGVLTFVAALTTGLLYAYK